MNERLEKALQEPGIYQCPSCGREVELYVRNRGSWCFCKDPRKGIEMVRRHPSSKAVLSW